MDPKIRYFLKACEYGSFSVAARELYISSQALNKQISLLEEELGKPLFQRSSHGIVLTDFGLRAQRELSRVVKEYDTVIDDLKDYANSGKEQIRIGIFSALPREELVLPLVSYLLAAHKELQFQLEMIELFEGKKKLLDGDLHFLLTNAHEQDDLEDYAGLSFGEYDAKVVVSFNHPWFMKEHLSEQDLRSETFIKMKMDKQHYTLPWEESFYRNIPCRRVLEAENFETMKILLHQASGFAVFPMAFSHMETSQLKGFDYPGQPLKYITALLYNKQTTSKALLNIVDGIREEFDLKEFDFC